MAKIRLTTTVAYQDQGNNYNVLTLIKLFKELIKNKQINK